MQHDKEVEQQQEVVGAQIENLSQTQSGPGLVYTTTDHAEEIKISKYL